MLNILVGNALAASETIKLTPGGGGTDFSQVSGLTIGGIISALITFILIAASIIFFFMLVIGGIRWILSGGDKGQTESARSQITAALIGLVIVFAAWAISNIIGQFFFGKNIFQEFTLPSVQTKTGSEQTR
jgi:cbb3-type cytochrome oxidase subunit 3